MANSISACCRASSGPASPARPSLKLLVVLDLARRSAPTPKTWSHGGDGSALSRVLFHLDLPTRGLAHIGVEEAKGSRPLREATAFCARAACRIFTNVCFVEGDDIGKGQPMVVVTELCRQYRAQGARRPPRTDSLPTNLR